MYNLGTAVGASFVSTTVAPNILTSATEYQSLVTASRSADNITESFLGNGTALLTVGYHGGGTTTTITGSMTISGTTLTTTVSGGIGSPLSINSLREDLGYHHSTLVNWIDILKGLYLVFTIRPWHRNILRSIKKETKLFFFDWSILTDSGKRFENLLAVSLLRMAARFTEAGLGVLRSCIFGIKKRGRLILRGLRKCPVPHREWVKPCPHWNDG
jgi:hypothetical protein